MENYLEVATENWTSPNIRNFKHTKFALHRNDKNFFEELLTALNHKEIKYKAAMLTWAAELVHHRKDEKTFSNILYTYTRRFALDTRFKIGPTLDQFDDLFELSEEIWLYFLSQR